MTKHDDGLTSSLFADSRNRFKVNTMDKQLPSSPAACSVSDNNMAESEEQGRQEKHRHSPQLLHIEFVIRQ